MNHLSEQEIRAIVRDEIRAMVGANTSQDSQDIEYLPTEQACKKMGYSSPAQLREAVNNKTFRLGKEVQDRRSNGSAHARRTGAW